MVLRYGRAPSETVATALALTKPESSDTRKVAVIELGYKVTVMAIPDKSSRVLSCSPANGAPLPSPLRRVVIALIPILSGATT